MKYVKILGLLAVAAAAMMAFAGSASATTLTSPKGVTYTGPIIAEAEGHAILHNPAAKIECASTVHGNVEKHGTGVTVEGTISTLDFTGCTGSWTVTGTGGTLIAHWITGTNNATLTSTGATVTAVNDSLGITCRYATSATHIGTLTGAANDESHATLHINASIPFHSGSIFCGSGNSAWTAAYTVTTPKGLIVDA